MLYREIMAVCSEIHTKQLLQWKLQPLQYWHVTDILIKCQAESASKTSVLIYEIRQRSSPYRAVNTLLLSYKNQLVNAV